MLKEHLTLNFSIILIIFESFFS